MKLGVAAVVQFGPHWPLALSPHTHTRPSLVTAAVLAWPQALCTMAPGWPSGAVNSTRCLACRIWLCWAAMG